MQSQPHRNIAAHRDLQKGNPRVSTPGASVLCLFLFVCALSAAAAPFVYTANYSTDNVSVIDTATNAVVATIPVTSAPVGIGVSPGATRVYVLGIGTGAVSVINTATNGVIATIPVGTGIAAFRPLSSLGVVVSPTGNRVYVSYLSNSSPDKVIVIDAITNTVVGNVAVSGAMEGMVMNPSGTRIYVPTCFGSSGSSGGLSIIDTASNVVVGSLSLPYCSTGAAVNPQGTRLYIAGGGGTGQKVIGVVDLTTNSVITTISLGGVPMNLAVNAAGTRLYATTFFSSGVTIIDTATNAVVGSVPLNPGAIGINSEGTRVYVGDSGSSVHVVDTATKSVIATIPLPSSPSALVVAIPPGAVHTPSFALTVTNATVVPTGTSSASVQFQPRPQDVGTTASVYVFAYAPIGVVRASQAKRAPPTYGLEDPEDTAQCVLAQVQPDGTLRSANQGSLAPLPNYTNQVLTAQGGSVTVLDRVPTPNIAGATVFVGYGITSSAMFTNGTYQGALTVQGTVECPSATPTADTTPPVSGGASYQGLWLGVPLATESGWGVNVTHQGNILFATWFTYDLDGSGIWLVMSSGVQTSPGNFTGTLFVTTGPAFNATPFTPLTDANYFVVGSLTFSFTDANNGTMSYTIGGTQQSKNIQRYVYATGGTNCTLGGSQGANPNYQDLWLVPNLAESGWGVNITHQGDTLFATWFTYDPAREGNGGKHDMWLVMSSGARSAPGVYTGTLQRTTGPPFNSVPFDANRVTRTNVGTAIFSFSDANNGIFNYTVNGISQSKPITRYIYSSPATVCR